MACKLDHEKFLDAFEKWLDKNKFDGEFFEGRDGWFILARGGRLYLPSDIFKKYQEILIANKKKADVTDSF